MRIKTLLTFEDFNFKSKPKKIPEPFLEFDCTFIFAKTTLFKKGNFS